MKFEPEEAAKKFLQKCNTIEDTRKLAKRFAGLVKDKGCFINLFGEIGAGKTAFVRFS